MNKRNINYNYYNKWKSEKLLWLQFCLKEKFIQNKISEDNVFKI